MARITTTDLIVAEALYGAGVNSVGVGRAVGVHRSTIRVWAVRYGWRRDMSQAEKRSQAEAMYRDPHITVGGISARLGISEWAIYRWANKYGWPKRKHRKGGEK